MPKLLLALLCLAASSCAQDYKLGPDSQPQDGTPKGVVTKHVLPPGKYYPGTPHNYSVYVPAQYNAAKPTPFMIYMDGSGAAGNNTRVPVVFDNLIAKGDLPPMIGIFVDPGVLPAVGDVVSRYERVFEYDSLSDRYANFLIEELIPAVAKSYNLSKDPNDRGLSGASTGAVAAFVAAWNRPDQFRRVLSFIGTYVAMKGADGFPALIRKSEPKPLRVFLQAGKKDHIEPNQPYGTFYGGSWPINNRVMADAFESAGYDVRLELGEEGHNGKHMAAVMPDALRWLWRGYPQPIVSKPPAAFEQKGWDPRGKVLSTIWLDRHWEKVGGDYSSASGVATDKDGNVYFSALDESQKLGPKRSRIYKVSPDGKSSVFVSLGTAASMMIQGADGRPPNGIAAPTPERASALQVGPDGRLYAALRRRIVSYGPSGDEKVVADKVEANAIAISAKGGVYYVDSKLKTVGFVAPGGANRVVFQGTEFGVPAGIALSPDQRMLVVTDSLSRFSWSFQITADGALVNGEPFFRLEMPESGYRSGAESVALDTIGQVYFATAEGIQVCEANGRTAMILAKPERGALTNIAFAGKEFNWLYAVVNGHVYRRPVKVSGAPAWSIVKMPKPPL